MERAPDQNVEDVRQMLLDRCKVGMAKYGRGTDNRQDIGLVGWLRHQLEELLDAAVYVMAAIKNIDGHPPEPQAAPAPKTILTFTYFKPETWTLYSEGTCEYSGERISDGSLYVNAVRDLANKLIAKGKMPGLSGTWRGPILITCPEMSFPLLIDPKEVFAFSVIGESNEELAA